MPQSRKWQLTFNNPEEHGFSHEVIVEAIEGLSAVTYWCMCDEIGAEETYHTHLYIVFENPKAHTVIGNAFPGAHRENVKGTSQQNRDYVLKDGEKYNKQPDGTYDYVDSSGKRESFLVLTERFTRFELIFRVSSKSSAATVKALDRALSKFPQGTFQSITVDNGCEFQDCYGMEYDAMGHKRTTVYYCHPYCSSERGSNERANRIIRRYFPKKQSLKAYTQKDCDRVAAAINDMHRRILGYATAAELFALEVAKLQTSPQNIF